MARTAGIGIQDFGKKMRMITEQFFFVKYAGRSDLFEGLFIWKEEKYRALQGTYPVISLSFVNVKEKTYQQTKQRIGQLLTEPERFYHGFVLGILVA